MSHFNKQVTVTLNSGGGDEEEIVRVGSPSGALLGYRIESDTGVPPVFEVYQTTGQASGTFADRIIEVTPAAQTEAATFADPVSFENRDSPTLSTLYIVVANATTEVLTIDLQGVAD